MKTIKSIGLILFLYVMLFQTSFQDPQLALLNQYRKVNAVMLQVTDKQELLLVYKEIQHLRDSMIIDSLELNERILRKLIQLESQINQDLNLELNEMVTIIKELRETEWQDQ